VTNALNPVVKAFAAAAAANDAILDPAALPGRDLDRSELLALVVAIAGQPELWREHLAFDDDRRHFVSLYRDSHVDVWMLCWTPQNDTGWHDHDVSSGAVAVAQGCLLEHKLAVDRPSAITEVDRSRPRQRLDSRVLAAVVANGPVRGQHQRDLAPGVPVLRRRAAPARLLSEANELERIRGPQANRHRFTATPTGLATSPPQPEPASNLGRRYSQWPPIQGSASLPG
jgi:hypothetical protein